MDKPRPLDRPTSEQIVALPTYEALRPARIHVLTTSEQLEFAERELRAAMHVGFDTESKPVFAAGAPQTGPDVIQFATVDDAFIVQTSAPGTADFLRAMIESDEIVRVGFGLASRLSYRIWFAGSASRKRSVSRLQWRSFSASAFPNPGRQPLPIGRVLSSVRSNCNTRQMMRMPRS